MKFIFIKGKLEKIMKKNLLLSNNPTFIKKSLNPKGLIVDIHYEKPLNMLYGFVLIENTSTQDIRYIKTSLNKWLNF